jgi:hypothetical protein
VGFESAWGFVGDWQNPCCRRHLPANWWPLAHCHRIMFLGMAPALSRRPSCVWHAPKTRPLAVKLDMMLNLMCHRFDFIVGKGPCLEARRDGQHPHTCVVHRAGALPLHAAVLCALLPRPAPPPPGRQC